MLASEVLSNVFCHSQWNCRTFISECWQMKGCWCGAQLLISPLPACSAEERCCSSMSLFKKKTSVFFASSHFILSQFTQGMDSPIFWGSNIMTALDISVLTVPLAVVFQNNFTCPFQGINFPGYFSFDSCWVFGRIFLWGMGFRALFIFSEENSGCFEKAPKWNMEHCQSLWKANSLDDAEPSLAVGILRAEVWKSEVGRISKGNCVCVWDSLLGMVQVRAAHHSELWQVKLGREELIFLCCIWYPLLLQKWNVNLWHARNLCSEVGIDLHPLSTQFVLA